MAKKEDRRVRLTKMLLKDSLILLLEDKDISKITITEICEKADINRATFYAHYADQYDLLKSIEKEFTHKIIDDLNYRDRDKQDIYQFILDILTFIKEHDKVSKLLLSDRGDMNFPKEIIGLVYDRFLNEIKEDMSLQLERSELIFSYVLLGCVGIIQKWLEDGYKTSTEELADIITTLATDSIKHIGLKF